MGACASELSSQAMGRVLDDDRQALAVITKAGEDSIRYTLLPTPPWSHGADMKFMHALNTSFKNRRRYTLAQLPGWLVLATTLCAFAQAWFWSKRTLELGAVFIADFDRYGPFYWQALVCFVGLVCLGFLALVWACIADHLRKNLQSRLFAKS